MYIYLIIGIYALIGSSWFIGTICIERFDSSVIPEYRERIWPETFVMWIISMFIWPVFWCTLLLGKVKYVPTDKYYRNIQYNQTFNPYYNHVNKQKEEDNNKDYIMI